jgi:hypothetical protein
LRFLFFNGWNSKLTPSAFDRDWTGSSADAVAKRLEFFNRMKILKQKALKKCKVLFIRLNRATAHKIPGHKKRH